MALAGFDVSVWQAGAYSGGGGFDFGIAKATEGNGFKDPSYDRHIAAIRASGVVPGAYHFARPDLGNAPELEADWFLTVVGDPTGMLLALDAESNGGSAAWCDAFQQHVAQRLGGYHPLFYSFWNWMQSRGILGSPIDGRDPLWLAWPDASGALPTPCSMQQYGLVSVPGVAGGVDADRFFGDLDQLRALTVGGNMTDDERRAQIFDWYCIYAGRAPISDADRAEIENRWLPAHRANALQARFDFGLAASAEVPGQDVLPARKLDLAAAIAKLPAGSVDQGLRKYLANTPPGVGP